MDEVDHQIVAQLTHDGRASYGEIGDVVGLSAPAVKRRIDRLRETGVILGFTAVVDPAAYGPTVEAFLEVHCTGGTGPDAIRAALEPRPEVIAAYTITGDADALVHVRTRSIGELERAIEHIHADPNVERTKSVVVLSHVIDRTAPQKVTRRRTP